MRMVRHAIGPLALLCAVAACGRGHDAASTSGTEAAPAAAAVVSRSAAADAGGGTSPAPVDRKLIRTGGLDIHVSNVRRAVAAADSVATQYGAYLADSRVTGETDGQRTAHLTFRVPADRFGATLAALRPLGDVRAESVSTQDVSKAYVDLQTRIAVKEQAVARLRNLIDTHTAKLADVLEVERQLANEMSELEQMKGESRYFDQQVALSTLTLDLFEGRTSHLSQLTTPVGTAFRGALEVLGSSLGAAVYLTIFLLPWVLLVALGVWIVRWLRARGVLPVRQPPARKVTPGPPLS